MSTQEIGPALGFKYSSLIENAGSKRGGDHHAFAQNILLVSDFCLVCVSALVAWYLRFVVLYQNLRFRHTFLASGSLEIWRFSYCTLPCLSYLHTLTSCT